MDTPICCGCNARWHSHFGKQFGWQFLVKLNIHFSHEPAVCIHLYLTKWNEYLCSHKNLCVTVDSGFIHNHQKLERNQMPLNGVTHKHNMIHSCNGLLLSVKRNELLICLTTWPNLKYIVLSKEVKLKSLHAVWFPLIILWLSELKLQIRWKKTWMVARGVEEVIEVDCKGVQRSFLGERSYSI